MKHDWLTELHRTGGWRALAEWLAAHEDYLAPSMADFAVNMVDKAGDPTPKQFALLVSLRGGVEALMRLEAMQRAAVRPAATASPAVADGAPRLLH